MQFIRDTMNDQEYIMNSYGGFITNLNHTLEKFNQSQVEISKYVFNIKEEFHNFNTSMYRM